MTRWLLLLLLGSPAHAALHWVNNACANDGDGTANSCATVTGGVGSRQLMSTVIAFQSSASCTAPGAPLACCTGAGTGTCDVVAGDTINVRAGIYFDTPMLRANPLIAGTGRAITCTVGSPCVLQNYNGEVVIDRGIQLKSDWTNEGGGLYSRDMTGEDDPLVDGTIERLTVSQCTGNGAPYTCCTAAYNPASPGSSGTCHFDPMQLFRGTTEPFQPMPYVLDNGVPQAGQWTYLSAANDSCRAVNVPYSGAGACSGVNSGTVTSPGCTAASTPYACCTGVNTGTCTSMICTAAGTPLACCTGAGTGTCTNRIVVNMTGLGNPALSVWVPRYGLLNHVQDTSTYWSINGIVWEGTRGNLHQIETTAGGDTSGPRNFTAKNNIGRYFNDFDWKTTRRAPFIDLENNLSEYGCRALSWAQASGGGCFAHRLFGVHNGTVKNNTVQHLGSEGIVFATGGAFHCPWCDYPWNGADCALTPKGPNCTYLGAKGNGYNIKQTDTVSITLNACYDLSAECITGDVSRHLTVKNNQGSRALSGIDMLDFTPSLIPAGAVCHNAGAANGSACTQDTTSATPTGCGAAARVPGACYHDTPDGTVDFQWNSDHEIAFNTFDQVGWQDRSGIGIGVTMGSERHPNCATATNFLFTPAACTFGAFIHDNFLSRVGYVGIKIERGHGLGCTASSCPAHQTEVADVRVSHNTIEGDRNIANETAPRGIIVQSATRNVTVTDNLLVNIPSDGLLTTTDAVNPASGATYPCTAAGPPTLPYTYCTGNGTCSSCPAPTFNGDAEDTIATNASTCHFRWNATAFDNSPTGSPAGSCDAISAHESTTVAGASLLRNISLVPADLHLTTGSVDIGAGINDSGTDCSASGVPFPCCTGNGTGTCSTPDIDGDARPQGASWDAGADEFVVGGGGGGAGGCAFAEKITALPISAVSMSAMGEPIRCVIP